MMFINKSDYQRPLYEIRHFELILMFSTALLNVITPIQVETATAQTSQSSKQGHPLYIHCRQQQYDGKTQVATCLRDVQLSYPSRGIQATAAQAQYFFRERRIVLSGNVYVLQQGRNSIKAETVTYLIDDGKFVATPKVDGEVQSIYIVDDKQKSK